MTTTSYNKAKQVSVFANLTDMLTITWKDWNGEAIVEKTRTMKAWEVRNLLDAINKLAFVKLAY